MVPQWVGNRPLIVAMVRIDQVSKSALRDWKKYYENAPLHPSRPDVPVFFVDGKVGTGVFAVKRMALKFSESVNLKRKKLGIEPRAVRAAIIGFPNVGKSALINKLLGRKLAKSMNMPGVTRSMQWIRLGKSDDDNRENELELLDSPGIIPAKHLEQESALRLAICNDIGEASYDRVIAAAAMCDRINAVYRDNNSYINMTKIKQRYHLEFDTMCGEDIVVTLADKTCQGNQISAADKLLSDFRSGGLGHVSLEQPPFYLIKNTEGADLLEKQAVEKTSRTDVGSSDGSVPLKTDKRLFYSSEGLLGDGKGKYDGW